MKLPSGSNWVLGVAFGLSATMLPSAASAATYYYVDWQTADVAGGTASGVIELPDGSTVSVAFAAINPDSSAGNLFGAQIESGIDYWMPAAPYVSSEVENAPLGPDILQLVGGTDQRYVVTLSEPIKDPIMAIVSLGQPGAQITYEFDSPFQIVSQGAGYWGGSDSALSILPDNVLAGAEGHGTIQFLGVFPAFSWTVPAPENWHGFTFGIRTTERLEPSVDAGADAGEVRDAAVGSPTDGAVSGQDATVVDAASADASWDASARDDAAASQADAAAPPDASPRADSGASQPKPQHSAECSCETVGRGAAGGSTGLFAALFALAFVRMRRRPQGI